MNSKELSLHLLSLAGIEINGENPWDIQVHDDRLWNRIISQRQLGLAEAYMDGWWNVDGGLVEGGGRHLFSLPRRPHGETKKTLAHRRSKNKTQLRK